MTANARMVGLQGRVTGTVGPGLVGEVMVHVPARGGTEAFLAHPAVPGEAVVAQQLAEKWPEIVQAGASAFSNVEHMVLLNGAEGMGEMFAKALTMGGTGLGLARQLLAQMKGDGDGTNPEPPTVPQQITIE
jgi:hypothetical protein